LGDALLKKKILLVSGCSWTNVHFVSDYHREIDTSWPKWHQILAEKFDLQLISLGKSGAGNEYIFSSLVDRILSLNEDDRNRIALVVAAWSRSPRRDYQVYTNHNIGSIKINRPSWAHERFDLKGDASYFGVKSLRYFYMFQVFCERYNIPYKSIQMLETMRIGNSERPHTYPHPTIKSEDIHEALITSPLWNNINGDNFIGWPLYEEQGGYSIDKKVMFQHTHPKGPVYRISDVDFHPNKEGNEKIAEFLEEKLKHENF